ncbi:asparaginase-domain-containing protein [Schizopora paradoxa]|uniref:asparaginase n=1 Tax=Schizopora paradoxa TaxID=27342 RepID=A0A0H2RFC5_9AGAM|nr:asparaginase-domain-containing protein [Schizopora paradoxa]
MTEILQLSDESRVLVIFTGGTIGMLGSKNGLSNEPNVLLDTLRSQSRFHDPHEDSLYSHSSSVEGYRSWSGRSSPAVEHFKPSASGSELPSLPVRSSRPLRSAMLSPDGRPSTHTSIECRKMADGTYEGQIPSLITPRVSFHGGQSKRIRYAILEWDPLLDSSNVETDDWVRIATEIELNYTFYDAFVVLHGTDTMCYTSSALSFMLEDLGKTVILTGAQIPLSQLRNDAVDNLLGALSIAGLYIIPECCVFFNQCLFRGSRVSKVSSFDLDAFNSPNFAPLVKVGIDIVVNWNDVIRQTSLRRFRAHKLMNSKVATLRLFPGITADIVSAFLKPPIQGVVLETFGAGNAPQRADLMAALSEASERGVVIVAITQCTKGAVSDKYETGRSLLQAGVVPGADMTPECALTKLGYLLSKPELSLENVKELMRSPLRGELTLQQGALRKPSMDQHSGTMQDLLAQVVRLSSVNLPRGAPQILVSPSHEKNEMEAAAPWSWTAGEAQVAELSLLPFLIHLAVAKDDVDGVMFCLQFREMVDQGRGANNAFTEAGYAGGVVNAIEPSTGRTPLHIAAFNGSEMCLSLLLQAGALVHLRDMLGHTPLYYAARRGHLEIVETLRKAGANLGGSDIDAGFVNLEINQATLRGDTKALEAWSKAGADVNITKKGHEAEVHT